MTDRNLDPKSTRRDVLKLAGAAVVGIGGAAIASTPAFAGAGGGTGGAGGIFTFGVSTAGGFLAYFNEVVEMKMADGGGGGDHEAGSFELVLKRGTTNDKSIYDWFAEARSGKKAGRRAAQLIGYAADFSAVMHWNLTNAFPAQIVTSSETVGTDKFLVEVVTFHTDLITPV